MSLFIDRVPKSELGTRFTHYALFAGIVPVYLGDVDSEAPVAVERNGCPGGLLELVAALFGLACALRSLVDPEFEPLFPFKITGRIKRP